MLSLWSRGCQPTMGSLDRKTMGRTNQHQQTAFKRAETIQIQSKSLSIYIYIISISYICIYYGIWYSKKIPIILDTNKIYIYIYIYILYIIISYYDHSLIILWCHMPSPFDLYDFDTKISVSSKVLVAPGSSCPGCGMYGEYPWTWVPLVTIALLKFWDTNWMISYWMIYYWICWMIFGYVFWMIFGYVTKSE